MKQLLSKLFKDIKGSVDITSVVVDVALVVALIPVIKTFIGNAQNLTATETTLLALVTLFIVIALIVNVIRQSGLAGKRN